MPVPSPPHPPFRDPAGRFRLRPWRESDVDALVTAWADPDIARFCEVPDDASAAHAIHLIRGWSTGRDGLNTATLDLVVAGLAEDDVWGEVGLKRLLRPRASGEGPDTFELGWWIHARHRGQGLAPAAVSLVVDWLCRLDGPEVVVARIPPGHTPSEHVATASGLRPRGALADGRTLWSLDRDHFLDSCRG